MKKARFWITALTLALLASGLTFVITYTQVAGRLESAYAPYLERTAYAEKADEVAAYIDTYFIGEYEPEDLTDALAAGMVEGTGDRWSYYISADEMQSYYEQTTNSYSGIGVVVNVVDEGLSVKEVTPGSPAAIGGVRVGDVITAVNGASTVELGLDESKNRIRGEIGTSVTITVLRDGETFDAELVRGSIITDVATAELLEDGVGYIHIANFDQNCAKQTIHAIEDLLEQGATSLLFDVRFNPGGMKHELCQILDYLLPEGVIFQSVDYAGREEVIRSDPACLNLPMAVLINEDSYSAAEFFAAALHEYEAATVIGMQTCGKGYFQQTYVLSDGSALGLSSGRYCTPKGVSLAGVGLTPDVEVDLDDEAYYYLYYSALEHEDDPQLQAALEVLTGKNSANPAE